MKKKNDALIQKFLESPSKEQTIGRIIKKLGESRFSVYYIKDENPMISQFKLCNYMKHTIWVEINSIVLLDTYENKILASIDYTNDTFKVDWRVVAFDYLNEESLLQLPKQRIDTLVEFSDL
jgi:hypothetical protein